MHRAWAAPNAVCRMRHNCGMPATAKADATGLCGTRLMDMQTQEACAGQPGLLQQDCTRWKCSLFTSAMGPDEIPSGNSGSCAYFGCDVESESLSACQHPDRHTARKSSDAQPDAAVCARQEPMGSEARASDMRT